MEHDTNGERRRLEALHSYSIIDTPPEDAFDEVVQLAAELCGTPQAIMTLVDGQRQWFKARVGVELSETPRDIAFCAHTVASGQPLIVPDALADPRFAANPLVLGGPRIRFYAGYPLLDGQGQAIGSLAVMDAVPRELSAAQRHALAVLARQIMAQLELRRAITALSQSQAELRCEQRSLEEHVQARTRELQAANLALRRAETLYGALWQTTTDAVLVIGLDNVIRYANPAAAEFFGYAQADLVGSPLGLVQPARLVEGHKAGLARYVATNEKRMDWRAAEAVARSAAGVEIPVEVAFSEFVLEGERLFVGFIRDIRVRKQTEAALREEKERAQTILGAIADAVVAANGDGTISYMNPMAERLTAWTADEAIGQPVHAVLRLHDEATGAPMVLTELDASASDRALELPPTTRLARRNGDDLPVEGSLTRMSHGEEVLGCVAVLRDVSLSRHLAEQISHQARHDPLTGLANRAEFDRRLHAALERATTQQVDHSMLYLDLDQFKLVNDTCGHIAGDELLKQLAVLLSLQIRSTDVLARLGGDEFGVLLEGCASSPAEVIAEKLRRTVADFRFSWAKQTFTLTVSIGLVHFNDDHFTFTDVLSKADESCYMAKEHGRNRVHAYQPADEALARRHGEMEWVHRLQAAIEEDRLLLYAQPIFAVDQPGPPVHLEVLLRMRDREGALIPPMAFIPAAERYNLMPMIDRWVIQRVLRHLQAAPPGGALSAPACIAINVSAASLGDATFCDFVRSELRESAVPPASICFEVTETAAISNLSSAVRLIQQLRQIGCRFALDDFGSGMSSFGYLKNLPVTYLKIDGSFVREIANDPIARAIVVAIHQVGRLMGLQTIAEFVEDDSILQQLQDIGVDYAQGFGLGRPVPLGTLVPLPDS